MDSEVDGDDKKEREKSVAIFVGEECGRSGEGREDLRWRERFILGEDGLLGCAKGHRFCLRNYFPGVKRSPLVSVNTILSLGLTDIVLRFNVT